MKQELHHTLLGCGFRYTPAKQMPKGILLDTKSRRKGYYVKEYSTKGGVFVIALVLWNDPHIQLPFAYILQQPEQYKGRLLPHINFGFYLCYVAQMEADWNSNDLKSTYQDVDKQIQLTLDNSVASVESGTSNDVELEGEFSAYWQSEEELYLLAKPSRKAQLKAHLVEAELSSGSIRREYVAACSEQSEELVKWLNQRKFDESSLQEVSITTHCISVKPNRLAGVNWPPSCLREVLSWLKLVDCSAHARTVTLLMTKKTKRHILLLDVEGQDELAVYLELNLNVIGKRYLGRNAARKRNIKNEAALLGGKFVSANFKRLGVTRADRETLLSRNQPRPDVGNLSQKRIALIGCGTIGGYLAELLLRSGAGCGENDFHLYDDDSFKPHNFARHSLTAHNFGLAKSIALANSLKEAVHIAQSIKGINRQFPIQADVLSKYDIVIDATGRPPVSRRLAAVARTLSADIRPVIIHAFNDGNGRASKVLVDDGRCCYGCMMADPAVYRNNVDLRFEGIDQEKEKHISCGSTYTPYDAAVSHITAALAQEAVLNTLEHTLPWNYSEHMLDGSRSKKPRILKHFSGCNICDE
ncbi:TPA: E2/UBC family protein [Vibrio parahaemolyticus]